MGGFTDRDFDVGREARRRRRRHVTPPRVEPKIFTAIATLPRASSSDRESVELAQERLFAQATKHLDDCGYVGAHVHFTTDPPNDATSSVIVRLEVEMLPRDDGEWAAVHQAIAEDEADRAEAKLAKTAVEKRLDALAASSEVWGAHTFAEVSKAAEGAAQALREGFAKMRTPVRLPVDLTTAEAESTDTPPVS